MSGRSKFADLNRYFSNLKADEITLTFNEIERIIGQKLSNSAYQYPAYWYESKTHMLPKCWNENGYKMIDLNLKGQKATFIKINRKDIAEKNKPMLIEQTNNMSFTKKDPAIPIEEVLNSINKYYSELQSDKNARYLSWEHCYKQFIEANKKEYLNDEDIDYLSLHLGFYLASWGMLRGSSFLLQKDYRVHIDIIKELFKPCYDGIWGIDYLKLKNQKNMEILIKLIENIKKLYGEKRKNIREVNTGISDTLVTKVLLGTMGCVPAYDEYFKIGVGKYNITTRSLSKSSIHGLAEYYEENKTELENIRKVISEARELEYPQMKVLDMAFWQVGFDYK